MTHEDGDYVEKHDVKVQPEPEPVDWSWRSNRYAWWVVLVLTVGMGLSIVDRMIIAIMVDPIKADLGISDTQISLLHGLAFTMLYVVIGIPLGWLVDRWRRNAIAGLSVFFWSLATLLCGMANSFPQLFAARIGVGIGEAGISPASLSLISDYLPPASRAKGLLCLTLGTSLGGGGALVLGGALIQALGSDGEHVLPVLGLMKSWQIVFLILGCIGIAYSLVFLTIREPVRQERISDVQLTTAQTTAYIWSRRPVLLFHFLGVAGSALVLMALNLWIPSFLIRSLGWSQMSVGSLYGGCLISASIVGVLIAGVFTTKLIKKGQLDAPLKVAFVSVLLSLPPLALVPLAQSAYVIIPLLFVGLVLVTIPIALGPVFLQSVCANEVRGQVVAIYLLVVAIIGNVLGPLFVASITDYVVKDPAKVHISLLVAILLFLPLSAAFLFKARKNVPRLLPV